MEGAVPLPKKAPRTPRLRLCCCAAGHGLPDARSCGVPEHLPVPRSQWSSVVRWIERSSPRFQHGRTTSENDGGFPVRRARRAGPPHRCRGGEEGLSEVSETALNAASTVRTVERTVGGGATTITRARANGTKGMTSS